MPSLRTGTLSLLAVASLAWSGCQRGAQGDAHLYTRALTTADSYEEARDLCQRIRQPSTRGDCRVTVEETWDRLGLDVCHSLAQGSPELALWRDECVFQLAERQRAAGDLDGALVACLDTRFARQCAWHLIQDEAEASLDEPPPQAELHLERFASARRLPDAAMQFWLIRFRTAAAAGTPLDERVCAQLKDASPCLDALGRAVDLVLNARQRAHGDQACAALAALAVLDPAEPVAEGSWAPGPAVVAVVQRWQSRHCGAHRPSLQPLPPGTPPPGTPPPGTPPPTTQPPGPLRSGDGPSAG